MEKHCEVLRLREPAHRSRAVEALSHGQIIVTAFNGIYVLLGDADDPSVTTKIAAIKGRPQAKGIALVCLPDFLDEHVAIDAPLLQSAYPFDSIRDLYGAVHALGLILPAAPSGAPPHVVQSDTILNVWTEESALRRLLLQFRRHGGRALAGTSANLPGSQTITDDEEVQDVFSSRVPLILLDSFDHIPPQRRHSASIIDLTGPAPRLVREGSTTREELRLALADRHLGDLAAAPDVPRV